MQLRAQAYEAKALVEKKLRKEARAAREKQSALQLLDETIKVAVCSAMRAHPEEPRRASHQLAHAAHVPLGQAIRVRIHARRAPSLLGRKWNCRVAWSLSRADQLASGVTVSSAPTNRHRFQVSRRFHV